MAIYMISYDLKYPVRDYPKVESCIKSLGSCIKPLYTVWLVDTNLTSSQIRDRLVHAIDGNDKALIIPVSFGASSINLSQSDWKWIELHLKP